MTQVNGKRDYKHAYKLQKKTGETADQIERQKARQLYDKEKIDRKFLFESTSVVLWNHG